MAKIGNPYPGGSLWRKWDLHVHTPFSIEQHFGDINDPAVWERYIKDLESLPEDIKVLGINDYLFIEGYKKLKIEKENNGRLKNIDLLLPVVEFRIEKLAGVDFGSLKRINLHVIFSDELDVDIIQSQFLDTLQQGYTLVAGEKWTRAITPTTVAELGAEIKATVPPEKLPAYGSDLREGFNNLNLDEKLLLKTLEERDCFDSKYLIAVGKTEWDEMAWSDASIATKKSVINSAHIVFTAADSVESFQRAKAKLTEQGVNNNLLDCSDAHHFSDVLDGDGNPMKDRIGNCFTWIKADPTFEGLRQIIYEPEERVLIQELKPDQKEVYRVIEKIEIKDANFTADLIPLNPNLNVIIGSRSSGKTTLLNSIAKSVDIFEYNSRNKVIGGPIKEPPVAEVYWVDGTKTSTSGVQKGITYIPQNYINSLAEAEEGDAPILSIAERAIFDNGDEVSTQREGLNIEIESINSDIATDIFQLFSVRKQIAEQVETIKKIGDKKGIEEQIKKIEEEIKVLQKDLTPADQEKLKELRSEFDSINKEVEIITLDLEILSSELENPPDTEYFFEDVSLGFNNETLAKEFAEFEKGIQEDYVEKYIAYTKLKFEALTLEKKTLEDKKKKAFEENKDLIDKSRKNNSAEEKIKEKEVQDAKLRGIVREEANLDRLNGSFKKYLDAIIAGHISRSELRKSFVGVAKGNIDEIEYDATVSIDSLRFEKYLSDNINFHNSVDAKTELSLIPGYRTEDENNSSVLIEGENISIVARLLLDEKLKTKSGADLQKALEGLFNDFEFINYSLKYEGDSYPEMTPGKKSLVVLKLLVEASKDKYPILIDQPEDDLDSRSISNEIVAFLKEKKKGRQIILVTHNANIAVGADAEEIIVANRHDGQNKNQENVIFDYASGSIENTFMDKHNDIKLAQMGIREHACDLLEGGETAFENRRNKYNLE